MADYPEQYYQGWDPASAAADWAAKGKDISVLQQVRGVAPSSGGTTSSGTTNIPQVNFDIPDVTQYYKTPEIQSAKQGAYGAQSAASQYQSAASLFPYKLKQAIQEKLDYNKDIIQQQNQAMAEYFATPARAREQYQGIWDPFKREALVAEARSQAFAPYATLTDILGARTGALGDIIGQGAAAFQSLVSAQQARAEQARQRYADLFAEAQALASAALSQAGLGQQLAQLQLDQAIAQQQAEEDRREYEQEWPLEKALLEAKIARQQQLASGGSGDGGWGGLGTGISTGTGETTYTEEPTESPPYTPVYAGIIEEHPPGSGWYWVSNAQGGWD